MARIAGALSAGRAPERPPAEAEDGSFVASVRGGKHAAAQRRGSVEEGPNGLPVFLTIHPSFLLRLPDPVAKELETERFAARHGELWNSDSKPEPQFM